MPNPEEQVEICKFCKLPTTAHALDCSLQAVKREREELIRKYEESELNVPEDSMTAENFKKMVESGKITYEKQIEEVGEYIKKLYLENKENKTPEDFQKIWDGFKEDLRELNEEFHSLKNEFLNYAPVITARIKDAFDEELKGKYEKARKIIMSEYTNIASIMMKQFNDYPTAIREISRTITQERVKIENFKKIFEEIKSY